MTVLIENMEKPQIFQSIFVFLKEEGFEKLAIKLRKGCRKAGIDILDIDCNSSIDLKKLFTAHNQDKKEAKCNGETSVTSRHGKDSVDGKKIKRTFVPIDVAEEVNGNIKAKKQKKMDFDFENVQEVKEGQKKKKTKHKEKKSKTISGDDLKNKHTKNTGDSADAYANEEPRLNNDTVERNEMSHSTPPNSTAKLRFQRVEESKWTQELKGKSELQNNSFWNKKDDQFAVQAAEHLGQVRGKDFRSAKMKKKKASWRGCGEIPDKVNSYQFPDSD